MMSRSLRIAVALTGLAVVSPAFASDLCPPINGPTKSDAEIRAMLENQGYQIRKIDDEDGCVEAKGTDKTGRRVEIYVHPVSGEIVKVK